MSIFTCVNACLVHFCSCYLLVCIKNNFSLVSATLFLAHLHMFSLSQWVSGGGHIPVVKILMFLLSFVCSHFSVNINGLASSWLVCFSCHDFI